MQRFDPNHNKQLLIMFWSAKSSPEPSSDVKPEEILKTFIKVSQGSDQVLELQLSSVCRKRRRQRTHLIASEMRLNRSYVDSQMASYPRNV